MSDTEDQALEPFDYTASYSEIDPNFVEFPEMDDDNDDGDEDLLDEEAEPPEEEAETVTGWASYELQGRNLDEGSAWQSLASDPFTGGLDVEVEGLTAGASWAFRVRLTDSEGRLSLWSDVLQMSLPTDFTPPPAPTAPGVDENNGYITGWWDGLLTAATPKDMSHVALHLQQMHPDGDPDGEPGDPYRVGTLSEAGSFAVGFLLVGVLYRAYLTAVDTSGNTSPWSEVVEFTPSEAFNTDELEAGLEELNTKTLPELEQSLTSKANEATQAVEAFRTEWDESGWDPEAIDELRGRADATEAEVATAKAEAEQAKQDAATAQANAEALEGRADATDAEVAAAKAEAEQARQDAEAAQAKADAVEARADGLENTLAEKAEASELNELDGILRGSVDLSDQVADKFYGNMAVVSRLQAEEGWIGGVALGDETVTARHVNMQDFTASQGFIDHAFVNLIQGKQADFEAAFIDSFIAESAAVAQELVVGFSDNLLPVEELIDFRDRGFSSPSWRRSGSDRWRSITNQGGVDYLVRVNDGSPGDGESRITYRLGGSGVHTKPGEKFSVKFHGWQASSGEGDGSNYFRLRYITATGGYVNFGSRMELQSGWHDYTYTDTAPEGAERAELIFQAYDGSPRGHWGDFEWHRVQSGHVAVQGLLQATTGELEELFFDTAVGNAIAAGSARFMEVDADQIRSNSWTGRSITGALIQTHSDNRGVKIRANGDIISRSVFTEEINFQLSAVVGNFFSGTLRTQTSEGRGAEITEGNVTWQSMLEDGTVTRYSPYIRLHQDANTDESSHATIALLNAGNMLIAPGGQGTKMLQVDGVVSAPEVSARDSMSVVSSSGNIAVLSVGQLSLNNGATRLTSSALLTDDFALGGGVGLMMETTSSNQPAGLVIDGPRSYLVGRLPSGVAGNMMFAWEEWGGFDISSSSRRQSGTMTYGAPVPAGNRYPNLSASGNSGAWGAWRYFGVTGYNFTQSSFGWVVYRGDGSGAGNNRFYVEMIAPWN